MSHFSVAIITEGKPTEERIAKALAPYQENNKGDCPKEYMEFYSTTQERKEEYETSTIHRVKLANGTLVSPYNSILYDEVTKEEYEKAIEEGKRDQYSFADKYRRKKDLAKIGAIEVEIPCKELYPTFEDFMKDWCEEKKDEETNDYGYWENPNAKWDWWQVGGRFSGILKVANECAAGHYIKANSARIKDCVFPDYQEKYDRAIRFWELKVEEQPPVTPSDEEIIDDFYFRFYRTSYFTDKYKSKEEYAEVTALFRTYAIIDKSGKWISLGRMGWFGVSLDDENELEYIRNYRKNVFDNAGDNDYITIVDCHI